MNREELLRMAADILRQGNAKMEEIKRQEARDAAYGARVAGAIDYRKRPDGVWEMPR